MTQNQQQRNKPVIAIIDDDDAIRAALESLLKFSDYDTHCYRSAVEFLQTPNSHDVQCIISDIQMPGMTGIEMIEQLIARGLHRPVIFISAFPGAALQVRADLPGLIGGLAKPFDADELLAYLRSALNAQP